MELFGNAQTTMQRYESHVRELRRLFVFHGLSCGQTESFVALGSKLAESRAFRTDLSALARGIRDKEHGTISAEEMLTAVGLAIGGKDLVEGRTPALGVSHAVSVLWVMLDAIGGWREADGPQRREHPGVDPANSAFYPNGNQDAVGDGLPVPHPVVGKQASGEPGGPGNRVDVAIQELRVYLDNMDRRMSRLEPHAEDLPQTMQVSRENVATEQPERLQEGEVTKPEVLALPMEAPAAQPVAAEPVEDGRRRARFSAWNGSAVETNEPVPAAGKQDAEVWPTSAATELPPAAGHFSRGMALSPLEMRTADEIDRKEPFQREIAAPGGGLRRAAVMEDNPVLAPPEREQVEWRQRVGGWLGMVALIFAVVGLGGIAKMMSSPDHPGPPETNSATPAVATSSAMRETAVPETATSSKGAVASTDLPGPVVASAPRTNSTERVESGPASSGHSEQGRTPAPGEGKRETAARVDLRRREQREIAPKPGKELVSRRAAIARAVVPPPVKPVPAREELPPPPPAKQTPVAVKPTASGIENAALLAGPTAGGVRPVVEVRSAGAKVASARTPVYPAEALKSHTEATVVLNAFLAKDGTVRRMDVVKGAYGFNRSAMDAIWGWRYKPLVVHGQPVETETQITVDYRLH